MSERLCIRLRKHKQKTAKGFIWFAQANMGTYDWNFPYWFGESFVLGHYTDHGMDVYKECEKIIDRLDLKTKNSGRNMKIRRIVVGLFDLTIPDCITMDYIKTSSIDSAFDKINDRFGAFTLRTADILYQYAKESELSVDKHEMRFHGNL